MLSVRSWLARQSIIILNVYVAKAVIRFLPDVSNDTLASSDYQPVNGRHISLLSFPMLRDGRRCDPLFPRYSLLLRAIYKGLVTRRILENFATSLETGDGNNKYHHVTGSSCRGFEKRFIKKKVRWKWFIVAYKMLFKMKYRHLLLRNSFTNFLHVYRKIVTTWTDNKKNRRITCRRALGEKLQEEAYL